MSVIKKQAALSTLYSFIGVLVGTITQGFVIPNYLSTEQNGLLAIILSWATIFASTSGLGFNGAGTRFFNYFRDEKKQHHGYLNLGLRFVFVGIIITFLLLFLFKNQILKNSTGRSSLFEDYYWYIWPLSAFLLLFYLFDHYAKNLYNTIPGNFYLQVLQRVFSLLAILCVVFKWVSFADGVFLWMIALCLPTLFMFVNILKIDGFSLKKRPFPEGGVIQKEFYVFAAFSMITSISTLVITQLDKIMIYRLLDLSSTGIYNTCLLFGSVMSMSYMATNKASSAIVIDALHENDLPKIESIYQKSSIVLFGSGMLLLLAVYANIDHLFSFIKPAYSVGKTALVVIGLAKLIDLGFGINALIISNSKHYKTDAFLVVSFILVLYALNHLLIPQYGLNGAAWATVVATLYFNLARTYLIWKNFNVLPFTKELASLIILGLLIFYGLKYVPDYATQALGRFFEMCIKSGLITVIVLMLVYTLPFFPVSKGLLKDMYQKLAK